MKKFITLSITVLSIVFIFTICSAQITNKYALVIGINGYPHYPSGQKLKYADKDAELFSNFIMSKEGGLFHPNNIILLTNEDATKATIIEKINWLKLQVNYDNLVYIYFTGHGKIDENNIAYLMPYDADPKSPKDNGIRIDEFLQMIKDKIRVQSLISFIDACHIDSTAKDKNSNGNSPDNNQQIENIVSQYNKKWTQLFQNPKEIRLSFLSASPGEYSYEQDDLNGGYGIFTYFLVEGLRGAGDGVIELNNVVTVEELHRYVVTKVSRFALGKLAVNQHPVCTPNFPGNYPMSIVNLIDFSNKKTIDFSRLVVRVKGNSGESKKFTEKVENNIALILKAMNKRDISSPKIRNACTDIGYQQLQKIVDKTNPNPDRLYYPIRLLETSNSNYFQVRDITVFVEQGNTFNILPLCFGIKKSTGKIDELFFSTNPQKLKQLPTDSLQSSEFLNPLVQNRIMQFLSKYMTAYYVKDIDFIEKIFSEEALIIVGNIIRTTNSNAFIDEKIKYFIKTKPEYIESLKNVFEKDTFIRLEFNDIMMEKHQLENFVGVTIKQLWYAENYWDEGFLFLLFEHDIKNPDKFVLHVRAWQDDELDQGPLIGVHSVNFIPEVDTTQFSTESKEVSIESERASIKDKKASIESKKESEEDNETSKESKNDSVKDKEASEESKKESIKNKESSSENEKDKKSSSEKKKDSGKGK